MKFFTSAAIKYFLKGKIIMNEEAITNGEKIRLLTDLELAQIIAADFVQEGENE